MEKFTPVALLMEDEPLIAMGLEMALAEGGFDVTTVVSCEEALGWLGMHRPDVAIVDIQLRDGTSDHIAGRLADDGIPFIVHSGDQPDLHKDTAFARGLWVNKPAEPDELVEAALHLIQAV